MNNKKIIIGIDPDVDKSGVAYVIGGHVELLNLRFFELFEKLRELKMQFGEKTLVIIEGGWLNKSNWHAKKSGSTALNANIGSRTGANHETGRKIVEMAEHLQIKTIVTKPTKSKIKSVLFKKITGIKCRTNQEQRDAYMLIHGL